MKKTVFFCVAFLLVFALFVEGNGPKLKYNVDYLFKWTAAQMNFIIDVQKPRPGLKFMSGDELQVFCEKKTGVKLHWKSEDGGMERNTYINAFYWPPDITVYMRNDIPSEEESTEGLIVHEFVHYFQHIYRGLDKPSLERENEAQVIERKFCREHGFPVPGMR